MSTDLLSLSHLSPTDVAVAFVDSLGNGGAPVIVINPLIWLCSVIESVYFGSHKSLIIHFIHLH